MSDQRLALEHEAWAARDGLAKATDNAITMTFALMIAGLALVTLGASIAVRAWVIAPLRSLQTSIAAVSMTTPAPKFEAAERGDEIGGMARAVQYYMSDTLAQLRQEARDYARRAEQERRSVFHDDGRLTSPGGADNQSEDEAPA
jgi:methyl-accepting chemotaxis protein